MNANVTGRPETAPNAAAPVDAPGTDAGNGDATAKIVANGSDITSVCEAPRCRRRPGRQWWQRHLGRWQFGYRLETPAPRGRPMATNRCRKILQFPKYCDAPES